MKFFRKILFSFFIISIFSGILMAQSKILAQAADCDLTGEWVIDIFIIDPFSMTEQALADMIQEPDGSIHGTVTDANGDYPVEISAQVVGDQFVSQMLHLETDGYAADIVLEGVIDEGCNLITGTIDGELTSPLRLPLAGTFEGNRTIEPTPTPTPTPTPPPPFCFNDPSPIDSGDIQAWLNQYLQNTGVDINNDGLINILEAAYLLLHWQEPCE